MEVQSRPRPQPSRPLQGQGQAQQLHNGHGGPGGPGLSRGPGAPGVPRGPAPRPPPGKWIPCKYFEDGVECPWGHLCWFAHGPDGPPNPNPQGQPWKVALPPSDRQVPLSRKPCAFWPNCRSGDKCAFMHGPSEPSYNGRAAGMANLPESPRSPVEGGYETRAELQKQQRATFGVVGSGGVAVRALKALNHVLKPANEGAPIRRPQPQRSYNAARPPPPSIAELPAPQTPPVRKGQLVLDLEGVDELQIPDALICPITHEVLRDPVTLMDGYTYERHAISNWLEGNDTSPMTNEPLFEKHLVPNLAIRRVLETLYGAKTARKAAVA